MEFKGKEELLYVRELDWSRERPDGYQFQIGELVKVFDIIDKTWKYYYVTDDYRRISYCSYTYGVADAIRDQHDGWFTVYSCEPKDIEPCSIAEKILYGPKK